jgi:hypothetical protein
VNNPIRERLETEHDAIHTARAITVGRFILTFTNQSSGAPIIDKCGGKTGKGTHWRGYALHLSPWRRNHYGDRAMGKALCLGVLER